MIDFGKGCVCLEIDFERAQQFKPKKSLERAKEEGVFYKKKKKRGL